MNPDDISRALRSQIEHENTLISERITWFFSASTILFAADGAILNAEINVHFQSYILVTVASLGLTLLLGLVIGLIGSQAVFATSKSEWRRLVSEEDRKPFPMMWAPQRATMWIRWAYIALCGMALAWAVLIGLPFAFTS